MENSPFYSNSSPLPILESLLSSKKERREGHRTASSLTEELGSNAKTIKKIVAQLLKNNPHYKDEIQGNLKVRSNSVEIDAYSPEFVELIKQELGEEIKEGYKTAFTLSPELKTGPSKIKKIEGILLKRDSSLSVYIQRKARIVSVKADAYSPEFVELIKQELGEETREGYRTAESIREDLKTSVQRIKNQVEEVVKKNPLLEKEIQRNAWLGKGGNGDAYSPKLIELIKLELGEIIKDGYRVASAIRELKSNPATIESAVRRLIEKDETLTVEIQKNARTGTSMSDAYSPKLVELIKQELGKPRMEGYRTVKFMALEFKTSSAPLDQIIKGLLEKDPQLKDKIQKNARLNKGGNTDVYSPEFVELIKQELGETIKDNYKTAYSLTEELDTSAQKIKDIVEEMVSKNPLFEKEIQRKARSGSVKTDAYSSKFVELIRQELGEKILEGYRSAESIREDLKMSTQRIKNQVEEMVKNNPLLEKEIQRRARPRSGPIRTDAYSPKLVELISVELNSKKNDRDNILKIQEQVTTAISDIKNETVDTEQFRKLMSLFGSARTVDLLYAYNPEFKRLPVDYLKSELAKYLGDYMVVRSGNVLQDVELALPYLGVKSFQDSLFTVIKEDAIHYYQKEKKKNREEEDSNILDEYIALLKDKAILFHNDDFSSVIDRVEVYIFSLANDFNKPETVVHEINRGRTFPDLNQTINIKEVRDEKRVLIGDEMGMGKSASAILSKEYLGVGVALVVVPSNVISTWHRYLSDDVGPDGKQLGYFKKGSAPQVLELESVEDIELIASGEYDYVVISHEKFKDEYAEKLKDSAIEMVIIDEVHKFKNVTDGKRSQALLDLMQDFKDREAYTVLLSGTPVPNKIKDLAVTLKLLYPEEFGEMDNAVLVSSIIKGDNINLRDLLFKKTQMKKLMESVEMPEKTERDSFVKFSEKEQELYELLLEDDELTATEKLMTLR